MSNSALYQPAAMEAINSTATSLPWNFTDLPGNATDTDDKASCGLFTFILYAVAMGLTCVLGFTGNTISFLVLHKDHSTPVASFLLKALTVADNLFLVLWMIHYSVRELIKYLQISETDLDPSWLYVRVYSFPLLYMTQTLTIWLTVVIALNRFMAVCVPYRAPHLCNIINVYKEVAVVTVFSIVYNIPRFFELEVVKNDSPRPVWNRTELGRNELYKTVYTDVMYYIFSFVLPLLILAFVNTRVIIAYQAMQARKHRMLSRRSDRENNITLVMIMVVVIFMLCQAPARIVQLVWNYSFTHCKQFVYYLIHISNTLEVLNSSLNFIIYYTFHTRFREIFLTHFCCSLASTRRRDSTKFTTTEGLSLEEVKCTTVNSKRSSSSKNSNPESARNGSLQGTVVVQSHNHVDKALEEIEPLQDERVEKKEEAAALEDSGKRETECEDDETEPLTP